VRHLLQSFRWLVDLFNQGDFLSTQIFTKPGIFAAAVTETAYPYTVDVSNYLSGTDSVSSVTAKLTLVSTGATLTSGWQNSITVLNNFIIVNINISRLQLGQLYQITVHFTASTIKKPTFTSIIAVIT
jgi:hypothetical protein